MKDNSKYNLNISFLRAFFCLAILFYHLDILKGGYLAVCSFFVLMGYFTTLSLFKNSSIKNYLLTFIKKIYLPLIIVVFSTISIMTIFKIDIFNIKNEISSIIFGYNNYWQLSTNSDYFAKHISSPFMHLWFTAILIQIKLIFPFIFIFLKRTGQKISKIFPCLIVLLLIIFSTLYFYDNSFKDNIMFTYYDSFSRIFSFLFGVLIGLFHNYFKDLIIKKISKPKLLLLVFVTYILILLYLFITIDSSSKHFAISMIITTFVTFRLIKYSNLLNKNNIIINNPIINFISNISYEIYLVQYPVIFMINKLDIPNYFKIIIIILLVLVISWIIHFALNIFKKKKLIFLRIIILIPLLGITGYGLVNYIQMEDHTEEINVLKDEMDNNQKIMEQKQQEYKNKQKQEQEEWDEYLKSTEVDEEKVRDYVSKLRIVGVGDSVLVNAIPGLYKEYPNGYFDGKVSRNTCAGAEVLEDLKNQGFKWDAFVFNLGTNGVPTKKCKDKLMDYAQDKKVFWLTATNADYDTNNSALIEYASSHPNIYILDWDAEVKKHPEYLYSDYTHLKPAGVRPYIEFIKEGIYKAYLEDANESRNKSIIEHEEKQKDKISFFGNDLLVNSFDELHKEFEDASFETDNDLDYNKLKSLLEEAINNNSLNQKVVLVLDNIININNYEELINICSNHDIYIVTINNKLDINNAKNINFEASDEDLLSDKIHLSDEGKKKLVKLIKDNIK